jgi:hypothetical protein
MSFSPKAPTIGCGRSLCSSLKAPTVGVPLWCKIHSPLPSPIAPPSLSCIEAARYLPGSHHIRAAIMPATAAMWGTKQPIFGPPRLSHPCWPLSSLQQK